MLHKGLLFYDSLQNTFSIFAIKCDTDFFVTIVTFQEFFGAPKNLRKTLYRVLANLCEQ